MSERMPPNDGDDTPVPSFGDELIAGLQEALAYQRGEGTARVRAYEHTADGWKLVRDATEAGAPPATTRRVRIVPPPSYDAPRIRALREQLGFSQRTFAAALNVSQQTVSAWEQGVRAPDGPSRRLLEIAETQPEAFLTRVLASA